MTTRRIIHCSQCGQEGHNRRNFNCPLNIELRERAEETQENISQGLRALKNAEKMNNILSNLLFYHWRMNFESINDVVYVLISSALIILDDVLKNYRIASVHFNILSLLEVIGMNVSRLNAVLFRYKQNINPSAIYSLGIVRLFLESPTNPILQYRAVYQLLPVGPFMPVSNILGSHHLIHELIQPRQNQLFQLAPLKRTSEYFKELSIETSDTNCDGNCPICFDDLNTQNVVLANCGHGHCVDCLKGLATSMKDMTKEPTCTLCRGTLTKLTTGTDANCVEIIHHIKNL